MSLNDIVTVNIDIASPAVDSASFDNLLIVGPGPATAPPRPLPLVGVYSDLTEVTDDGYIAIGEDADPIGIAARIAFSQNPKPSKIFVAAQPATTPLITGGDLKIITASNALSDAVPIGTIDGATAINLPWVQIEYSRSELTGLEVEIEKDGEVKFSQELPTGDNPNAYLQVCIGTSPIATDDMMEIPSGEEKGTYTVTLTATRGKVTTVIKRAVTFNGTSYTQKPAASVDATTPATLPATDTLRDALDVTGWYVICAAGIDESEYEEIAEWTETQTKQFAYTFLGKTDPVSPIFYRSHGWCGLTGDNVLPEDNPVANSYLHVAAVAKALSYPAGSETWAFKQLAAVNPSTFSGTLEKSLQDGHSNFFIQAAGKNITMIGQVRAGEWIDVIRGRDWLQNDMQLRIFNLLIMNPKIPYTNSGIALVENQMIASLKAAQKRGIVAFDEYDEDSVLVPGYITSVPNSMSLTASQKASRILTDCKFSARLAGAIHAVRADGALTY